MSVRSSLSLLIAVLALGLLACPPEDKNEGKSDSTNNLASGDAGPGTSLGGKELRACASVTCGKSTRCAEVAFKCKAGKPCAPVAQCLPDDGPGCSPACAVGEVCHVTLEGPTCVSDDAKGTACGPVVCGRGLSCCNESCGICTAEGEACTQQECDLSDPCETVTCEPGKHCERVDVECVSTPCLPVQCVPDPATCDDVKCEPGQHCELIDPGCKSSACTEVAQCVKDADPCAALTCDANDHCEETETGAQCVPNVVTCATTLCRLGTYCDDSSGTPECKPEPTCGNTDCPSDTYCDLQTVTCVRAPCPADPVCVRGVSPCASVKCLGTSCRVVDGKAQCVGETCGDTVCGAGESCCNASCGICTSGAALCLQILCNPPILEANISL